jgi:hypothetical protein
MDGINIRRMTRIRKAVYMFNVIPIKIPMTFITEIEKSTRIFIWERKRQRIKAMLSKKKNAGGIIISDLKLLLSHTNKNSMILAEKQR